jgi:hypothetical protein
MTSISAKPAGSPSPDPAHPAQAGLGHFMLTLCALAAPVSIRQPKSPQLAPFTFFMSRARESDGSEQLYLHMGYFDTMADAERWAELVRRHYPTAFATSAPVGLPRPGLQTPSMTPGPARPVVLTRNGPKPAEDDSLTDTQVLGILESRGGATVNDEGEDSCEQIALLRPDDTVTRLALKEAVVQGAPVSFAVQLHWSAQPIDLSRVPSLAIFEGYTLYATEIRRNQRSRHFLRLGFFADPISAKQVAVQVLSKFASAAVIPVVEQEIERARETSTGSSEIPLLVEQRFDAAIDSDDMPESPTQARSQSGAWHRASRDARTVESHDSLSDSGVRHLRIEVQEELSGQWKRVRFSGPASNMAERDSSKFTRE